MSRHRSPLGRRAHLGPPLSALVAAAGVGGAHRSVPIAALASSMPARLVATVVAGGALAAAGQQALSDAVPAATEGANVLRLSLDELLGGAGGPTPAPGTAATVAQALTAQPLVAVAPVAPEPVLADAAELVKGAELQRVAAEAAQAEVVRVAAEKATADKATAEKVAAEKVAAEKVAAEKVAAERPATGSTGAGGGVQMIVGRLSSGFGARWGTSHQGLDIAAPIGTPINAPLAGTVISSGPASGFGLWVRLRHADGTITVYGHINRSLVRVGEQVTAGQEIAEVGNRGQSTGPHLHIGVMVNDRYVDPRPWLDGHGIGY